MKTMLISVFCALFVVGCASTQQRKSDFTAATDSWVGKSADDLVVAKGPPTGNFQLSTGQRILEYSDKNTVSNGASGFSATTGAVSGSGGWFFMPQLMFSPERSTTRSCKVLFTVTAKNIIESWKYEGNNCF
jgi:hypothetical protein